MFGIISAIVIGAILGIVGKLILPGSQKHVPFWLTIIVGIVAAFIGTYVAGLFGVASTSGIDWIRLVLQVIFAVAGIAVAARFYPKRVRS